MTAEDGRGPRRSIRTAIAVAAMVLVALATIAVGTRLAAGYFERQVAAANGLNRSLYPTPDFEEPPLSRGPAGAPDLLFIVEDASLPRQNFSVRWDGFWNVPQAPFDLYVRADDRVEIFVDGARVLAQGLAQGRRTVRHTLNLAAGVRPVRIDYVQRDGPARLALDWAPAGEEPRPLDTSFFREEPATEILRKVQIAGVLRASERVSWWALAILILMTTGAAAVGYWRRHDGPGALAPAMSSVARAARGVIGQAAAVAALTAAGAILRIEALVASYGLVPLGTTLEGIQTRIAALGPWIHGGRLMWREIGERTGDPVAYLNNARLMTWFYDGLAREPLFIYATKLWLRAAGDADIAVSAASTMFSVLCIPATYFVGRIAFGPLVGIIGAGLVAIEPAMIRWGVQGWRDDAFTFFFLAFAAASLWFRAQPSASRAVVLALAASGALLTRLTAASFIAPALLFLIFGPGGIRARQLGLVAIASALTAVLVAPYLVSSWMRHGDPLLAINRNTQFYRDRAGQDGSDHMRVDTYLLGMASARPVATADTLLQGVTTYPFRNKFQSLSTWGTWLPRVAAALAIGGVLISIWSANGRLLLVLLLFSLLPYAFTWQIPGGAEWRFTMHVYPLFLLLAVFCLRAIADAWDVVLGATRPPLYVVAGRAAVSLVAAGIVAIAILWLPYPRAREDLALEGRTSISPGFRDFVFFRNDWLRSEERDDFDVRTSRGDTARVWVPLLSGSAHRLTVEMLPAAPEGASLDLEASLSGHPLDGSSVPRGSLLVYSFDVPEAAAGRADGILEFRARTSFSFRSLRIAVSGRDSTGMNEAG